MPNVVVIEKIPNGTRTVVRSRLRWGQSPGDGLVGEKVQGASPGEKRKDKIDERLEHDFFSVAQL